MEVTFFGVRGSTPCHGDAVSRYGGNTSCVSVRVPGHDPLFLDMGTGLRDLGRSESHDGSFRGACLLSHLHWDHMQGLPFFTPLHSHGSELDVYAPIQDDGRTVADAVDTVIRPPLFPITVAQLPGTVRFHDVGNSEFTIGDIRVTARLVPHIGPTLGYRLDWGGHSVAYLSDHQQPHAHEFTISEGARELAEGVDLLIHDAQYSAAEFDTKSSWGHCTLDYALWVADQCNVGTLALFHHDPSRTDDALDEVAVGAAEHGARHGFEVVTAAEGLSLRLG